MHNKGQTLNTLEVNDKSRRPSEVLLPVRQSIWDPTVLETIIGRGPPLDSMAHVAGNWGLPLQVAANSLRQDCCMSSEILSEISSCR